MNNLFHTSTPDIFQSPLLLPQTAAKLRMSRKLIHAEFGIKIPLDQKSLITQINHYASQSHNKQLRHLARELKQDFPLH